MTRAYVITGGTGFLGARLVRRLLEDGHRVSVVDNNFRGDPHRHQDIASEIEIVDADVRDTTTLTRAVRGSDAMVHMAAINGTRHFYSIPAEVVDVSIRGALSVIDACRANEVGDLCLLSSSEVTLDSIAAHPEGVIPLEIQGDGSATRAFIHVADFTSALSAVLEHGEHLGIYHVGNPEEMPIGEVARRGAAWFGREARIIPGPAPAGGAARRCPDISKLRRLGFEPRIGFQEGLDDLLRWYAANHESRPKR